MKHIAVVRRELEPERGNVKHLILIERMKESYAEIVGNS